MGILNRIVNLFKATTNNAIDSAEGSLTEAMVKQSIIDAKENFEKMSEAVATAIAHEKQLQIKWDSLDEAIKNWTSGAANALKADREDLAREALERKAECQQNMRDLEPSLAKAKQNSKTLKTKLEEMSKRIKASEEKGSTLIARAQAAEADENAQIAISKISGNSPLDNMNSLEEKVAKKEAHADALRDLGESKDDKLEEQLKNLGNTKSVDEELAALKASMDK